MEFRSKKDGTHFPLGGSSRAPDSATFAGVSTEDKNRLSATEKPNIIFIRDPHRYGEQMSVAVMSRRDVQEIANKLKRYGWSGSGDNKIDGVWANDEAGQYKALTIHKIDRNSFYVTGREGNNVIPFYDKDDVVEFAQFP
jgi:hypothetical protein